MSTPPDKIAFCTTDSNNGGGLIVCVISAGIGLMFAFAKTSRDDGHDWLRYAFLGALFLLGLLMILYQKWVIVSVDGPAMEVRSGFWPLLRSNSASFAFAEKLTITTFSVSRGTSRGYNAVLTYSDGRKLRLLRTLDTKNLGNVARLSRLTNLPIEVKGGLNDSPNDPAWDALGLQPPSARLNTY